MVTVGMTEATFQVSLMHKNLGPASIASIRSEQSVIGIILLSFQLFPSIVIKLKGRIVNVLITAGRAVAPVMFYRFIVKLKKNLTISAIN